MSSVRPVVSIPSPSSSAVRPSVPSSVLSSIPCRPLSVCPVVRPVVAVRPLPVRPVVRLMITSVGKKESLISTLRGNVSKQVRRFVVLFWFALSVRHCALHLRILSTVISSCVCDISIPLDTMHLSDAGDMYKFSHSNNILLWKRV